MLSSRLWFLSRVTKLHGSIMKGQISVNQCMLSLKSWIKSLHFLKCGSRHTGSTAINILNGAPSIVPLVRLLHVQWLQNYLHLNVWKDILKISSRPLIQVERAFLVDSSFINWVYYNQGSSRHRQVISNQTSSQSEVWHDVWWPEYQTGVHTLKTMRIGNVISLSSNFSIKKFHGTNFSYSAIV